MKRLLINKFLCCIELELASLAIGWTYAIVEGIGCVTFFTTLVNASTNYMGATSSAVVCLVSVGFCVLLIIGVRRKKAVLVWLGMFSLLLHSSLITITSFIFLWSVGLAMLFVYMPITFYCAVAVNSFYEQMSASNRQSLSSQDPEDNLESL